MRSISWSRGLAVVAACALALLCGCSADSRAERLNRQASGPESMPGRIIDALEVLPGQTVADLGAGGGYFALQFARRVGPRGRVYAVDINLGFLDYISRSASRAGLTNVEAVLADADNSRLPDASIDLVFVRNVFHHLDDRVEYFRKITRILKPGGRIAVVEQKRSPGFSLSDLFREKLTEEEIAAILSGAGYARSARFEFLPRQSFNVFVVK